MTELLCCGRWIIELAASGGEVPFGGWPSLEWCRSRQQLSRGPPSSFCSYDADTCFELAHDLRSMFASADIGIGGIGAEAKLKLETIVGSLDTWASQLEEARGEYSRRPLGSHVYSGAKLIACIRSARLLCGGGRALHQAAQQRNK